MSRTTLFLVILVAFLLVALVMLFQSPETKNVAQEMTYTEFLGLEPHVRDVTFHGDVVTGHDDKNAAFSVTLPHDPSIATRLAQNHVSVIIGPPEDSQSWLTILLVNGIPLVAYVFLITWPAYRIARSLDALAGRFDRQGADRL